MIADTGNPPNGKPRSDAPTRLAVWRSDCAAYSNGPPRGRARLDVDTGTFHIYRLAQELLEFVSIRRKAIAIKVLVIHGRKIPLTACLAWRLSVALPFGGSVACEKRCCPLIIFDRS
jgi:hypothetical protein